MHVGGLVSYAVAQLDDAARKRLDAAEAVCVQRKHRRLSPWHLAYAWMSGSPQPLDLGTLIGACDSALSGLARIVPPERPATPRPWDAALRNLVGMAERKAAALGSKVTTEAALWWACVQDSTIGDVLRRAGASNEGRVDAPRTESEVRGVPASCVGLPGSRNLTGRCGGIVGRVAEVDRLCTVLLRESQRIAVLVGRAGSGRTSVLRALGARLVSAQSPPALAGMPLLALDGNEYEGGSELDLGSLFLRRSSSLGIAAREPGVILALDGLEHVHRSCLGSAIRPLLDASARVIITTTSEAWTQACSAIPRLTSACTIINLSALDDQSALAVAEVCALDATLKHAMTMHPDAPALLVKLSSRHLSQPQPTAAKLALDEAVAWHLASGCQDRLGPQHIADAVSRLAGVPVSAGRTSDEQRERLLGLEGALGRAVLSQERAVGAVARAVRLGALGLADPRRPIGSFLFVGPTGVGKTELAKALARELFESERALVRLDMSEYQDQHKVSTLIGSPVGYVDSDKGGILTEAIKRTPHAVVLFDEIEKGHPKILDLLLQVLDDGRLTDSRGETVSFAGCVLILTSNLGAPALGESKLCGDELEQFARDRLVAGGLRPEFVGRFGEVAVFRPLDLVAVRAILDREVAALAALVLSQGVELRVREDVREKLAHDGFDPRFGARPLRRAVERGLKNAYAQELLVRGFARGSVVEARLQDGAVVFEVVR